MPLSLTMRTVLLAVRVTGGKPINEMTIPEARRATQARIRRRRKPVPVASIADRVIPGPAGAIPIRVYTPAGRGPFPLVVFFHSGGFVVGGLDNDDEICRSLCHGADCIVVSVDYRLAPEHKFPAAPDDCLAATRWAAKHAAEFNADATRIALAGDSAGGNLAAVTALRIRDEGGPPLRGQLLIYPMTDYHTPATPSYLANANGYLVTRDMMIWFWGHYLNDASEANHPHASPLRAPDLSGLPPALVITAEYDPLRDEGERYAERLRQAGVPTVCTRYDGMIHGFFVLGELFAESRQAIDEANLWLRQVFDQPG
ncbi:MAG: alpha/beta hydrolase [Caldilineaceae bacterium]|nr:alpha/beta hydrolase [Caldilineaceae bacterium]